MKMLPNRWIHVLCLFFYILLYAHKEICLYSHITCLLLSAKTCLANVTLTGIKCYSWLFWIIFAENRRTAVMEIASSALKDVFWAASPSYWESDSTDATKANFWHRCDICFWKRGVRSLWSSKQQLPNAPWAPTVAINLDYCGKTLQGVWEHKFTF